MPPACASLALTVVLILATLYSVLEILSIVNRGGTLPYFQSPCCQDLSVRRAVGATARGNSKFLATAQGGGYRDATPWRLGISGGVKGRLICLLRGRDSLG